MNSDVSLRVTMCPDVSDVSQSRSQSLVSEVVPQELACDFSSLMI